MFQTSILSKRSLNTKVKPHLQCSLWSCTFSTCTSAHKQYRQISYKIFWDLEMWDCSQVYFIDCAGDLLEHPPVVGWDWSLLSCKNRAVFTLPLKIVRERIHIRHVWSSVFKLWRWMSTFHGPQLFKPGKLNATKWSGANSESRWGETIFATLEERSSRSHEWCSCWDTSSSALHWQKHQRKWSTAKIKIKLVGEGGAHRSQVFWSISITCLLF